MIYDSRMQFSAAQSVVGPAGTGINSSNVYDSGAVSRDLGNGQPLFLLVEVVTSILAGSAGTLLIQFVSSAAAALTTPTIHASCTLVTAATATAAAGTLAGTQAWVVVLPTQGATYLEYLGLIYTPGTAATTQGTVNAYTSLDGHGYVNYATAANIV